MSTTPKIKIPKGLPLAVASNKPLRKAVASLLDLKATYTDGCLSKGTGKLLDAALCCHVSAKTLGRRIKVLLAEDLLTLVDGHYWFSSWERIRERFDLDDTKFHWITNTGRDTVDILEQLAMRAPVDAQRNAYQSKIKYTDNLKEELVEVTGRGYSATAVLDTQLHHFFTEGKGYTSQECDALELIGADFSVGTDYYNDMFNYHGKGSMAYKKRKLERMQLIVCESRMYEMEGHTTRESRETKLGVVLPPSPREGRLKPILVMPDLITFLNPSAPIQKGAGGKSLALAA